MRRRTVWLGLVALLLASPAQAWVASGERWPTNATDWHVDIPEFAGRSDWSASFVQSMGLWSPDFQYGLISDYVDPCKPATEPYANGVDFRADVCGTPFGGTTLAVAQSFWEGGIYTQSGIVFKSSVSWDIYSGSHQGNPVDFGRVAAHELGHSLGLGHETVALAIMAPEVGDLEAPTADDRAGVDAIYSPPFRAGEIAVAPPADWVPIGPEGGPFVPGERVYRVYNLGTEEVGFGVAYPEGGWLDVLDPNGDPAPSFEPLPGGAMKIVRYVPNASAEALTPVTSTYGTQIYNATNGLGSTQIEAQIRVNVPGDLDLDGVGNASDICPHAPDNGVDDLAGVAGSGPDGIGDACQCGDVSDDAEVEVLDVVLLTRDLAGLLPGLYEPTKCRITPAGACDAGDLAALRDALAAGPLPGQLCVAATGDE